MILAVTGITGLLLWCVYKVISTPGSAEHIHSQADIDPHDANGDNGT